jgi:hypothetical protein
MDAAAGPFLECRQTCVQAQAAGLARLGRARRDRCRRFAEGDPATQAGGQLQVGVGQGEAHPEGVAGRVDHPVHQRHAGGHRRRLGQVGLHAGQLADPDGSKTGRGHDHLDPQRIDAGQLEDRLLLDPLAGRQVTLHHHALEGRAQGPQPHLGVRHPHLAAPHPQLVAGLHELLLGHLVVGAGLVEGLLGEEVAGDQVFGAGELLAGQIAAGLGGPQVGLGGGAAPGHLGGGPLHVAAQ